MKHKEEILSNLEQYCDEGKYERVVESINRLSKEERDVEVLGYLTRALNNLERYEEAKEVLEQLRATEEDTYIWQYRMGYCLYYLSFEHNYNKNKEEILLDAFNHFDSAITMGAPDYIAVDCETFLNLIDLELKKIYGFFDNGSSGCGSGCGCGSFDEEDMSFGCGSGCGCSSFNFDEDAMDFGCGPGCSCVSSSAQEQMMNFGCGSSCSSGCASSCGCGSAAYFEDENQVPDVFVGFVLLDENKWDMAEYKENFLKDWGFKLESNDGESLEEHFQEGENQDEESITIVEMIDGVMVSVSLMPAPIPDGEAEECAKNNYMWPEAHEVSKSHKAHLMITVIGSKMPLLERGKLFTKLLASAVHSKHTLGVYTCGVIFEPNFFYDFSMMIKQDLLPIYNWVWHGLYQSPKGISAYTYGMKSFGKDEIEILDTNLAPEELRDLLSNIVFYVLENDIVLHDGETIGFSEEEKLLISKGEGVSIPGQTIKISLS